MPHVIEAARTGRAKCRGCGQAIVRDSLRFGERVPNPFGDDGTETTQWFHVPCAAYMRPEAFLETLAAEPPAGLPAGDLAQLDRAARLGAAHHRVPRTNAAGRATSGRAACRQCREPIAKDSWRISLTYYEEGRFVPAGFVHLACARAYFETTDLMDRLRYFSPTLTDADWAEIQQGLEAVPQGLDAQP